VTRALLFLPLAAAACLDATAREAEDPDLDGVPAASDNCALYNPKQDDRDADGIGDACQRGIPHDFGTADDLTTPDGIADLAAIRHSDGSWLVPPPDGVEVVIPPGLQAQDRPMVGDYDGDGVADLGVARGAQLVWRRTFDATETTVDLPGPADQLVPADYDGDHRTDPATFETSTGTWYVRRSSDGVLDTRPLGSPGDIALTGDMDGDGIDDFISWRAAPGAEGHWTRWSSVDGSVAEGVVGGDGDIPLAADIEGNGRYQVITYRSPGYDSSSPNAGWYVGGSLLRTFGNRGDCPAAFNGAGGAPAELVAFRAPGVGVPNGTTLRNRWFMTDADHFVTEMGTTGDVLVPVGVPETCASGSAR